MGLLLVGVTFLAYLPVFRGQFVWDDDEWTTKIGGLLRNVSGLRLIWCQLTALQQYYPLTATTFWLDYHLWGFWPLPYHVENVLLHALAALLFWRLLERFGVAGAWLAAAIFALHPVMVESAGWITERKNVLSLVFYLGALLAYGRFNAFGQANAAAAASLERTSRWRWGHYTLALFLFLCALLAKTTAFSLPAVVLLIGWWKGGRLRWRGEVLPTVPFFVLSFGICLVTAWLEKNHVGAQGPDFVLTMSERCLIAGRALWFYTDQLLWPAHLCFVYPRWPLNAASWRQWLYPATAVGTLLALWLARKRIGRGSVAAAFFFVGTLFPVLGFMNAYGMRYSFVWDHWVYLPSLGLIALGAALVARAAEHLRAPVVLYGFAAVVLPGLAILTWRQCEMYANIETLWRTTIDRNPACWMAHNNLGYALLQKEQTDEAIVQFQKTLAIDSNNPEANYDLGNAFFQQGRMDEAIAQFQKTLAINSSDTDVRYNYADVHNNLGNAFLRQGRMDEAVAQFQKALAINPKDANTHYNLGNAYRQQGGVNEAITQFQKALAIKPQFAEAHYNLGNTFVQQGHVDKAIMQFQEALTIKLDYVEAQNNLAWVLATCPQASLRNGIKAVELAEGANTLTSGKNPVILATLAAAYAEAGKFPEAIETGQRALHLAEAQSNTALAGALQSQLKLYQAGIPFHGTEQAP